MEKALVAIRPRKEDDKDIPAFEYTVTLNSMYIICKLIIRVTIGDNFSSQKSDNWIYVWKAYNCCI